MESVFPFDELPNVAVFTTAPVLERRLPILLVTHDADDGGWQFLCGTTNEEDDARIVALSTILRIDPTVAEVAELPPGWRTWREGVGQPWQRSPRR